MYAQAPAKEKSDYFKRSTIYKSEVHVLAARWGLLTEIYWFFSPKLVLECMNIYELSDRFLVLPVDARALYTEGDAQVDAGPAGVWLTTVTAAGIAWDGQDLLQGALAF